MGCWLFRWQFSLISPSLEDWCKGGRRAGCGRIAQGKSTFAKFRSGRARALPIPLEGGIIVLGLRVATVFLQRGVATVAGPPCFGAGAVKVGAGRGEGAGAARIVARWLCSPSFRLALPGVEGGWKDGHFSGVSFGGWRWSRLFGRLELEGCRCCGSLFLFIVFIATVRRPL